MGAVSVDTETTSTRLPLAARTWLGAASMCTWPLRPPVVPRAIPGMPGLWLQIDWDGERWRSREGGATSRPVTEGAVLGRQAGLVVRLVDAGPPTPGLARWWPDLVVAPRATCDSVPGLAALPDGAVVVASGEAWRVLGAAEPAPGIDLFSSSCVLVVGEQGVVTVVDGAVSVRVESLALRALVPYVQARLDGSDGFLTAHAARRRFERITGERVRRSNYLAEQRARTIRALTHAGAAGATDLFETLERGPLSAVRIALPPERLGLERDAHD